jgi:hypothetical protein
VGAEVSVAVRATFLYGALARYQNRMTETLNNLTLPELKVFGWDKKNDKKSSHLALLLFIFALDVRRNFSSCAARTLS